MDRANKILENKLFKEEMKKIELAETDRIYCRHDMSHLIDVARLAYIVVLENGIPMARDVVYAAGLLHDIGRGCQYETGEPHDEAGMRIASQILEECNFGKEDIRRIVHAIGNHRKEDQGNHDMLGLVLYAADKKSRLCFACQAQDSCNWKLEKRNMDLSR